MVTAGALALLLGICLIITSATSLLLKASANRARKLIERTPVTPIGAWRPGRGMVAALGATAFGPGGPVLGPVSGRECAWYTVQLHRMPSRSKDESPPPHDVLVDVSAALPPAFTDSSGSVLIDPALLVQPPNRDDAALTEITVRLAYGGLPNPAPTVVTRRHLEGLRSGETLRVVETRLDAGKQAYALGSAGQHKGSITLRPTRQGNVSVLTPDEPSTILARRGTHANDARSLAITLGRAGLVVTIAATLLLFLVV